MKIVLSHCGAIRSLSEMLRRADASSYTFCVDASVGEHWLASAFHPTQSGALLLRHQY